MKEYIYEERNGIYIIDLSKTEKLVEEAYKQLYTIAQNGGSILFVGTRKQTQDVIKEEATRANQYFVDQRWLGGTLTNFKTIRKSIGRLFKIEEMEENGTFEVLPKKEVALLNKEKDKLIKYFSGIRNMRDLPNAMVVVDPKTEHNAVAEARRLNIPVFGLVDTNCDPDEVDFVIPANDDAIRSVKLIVATLANAVVEANGGTPIVIEFTDEVVQEDRNRNNRNRRYNNNYRDGRDNRDGRDKEYYRKPRTPRVTDNVEVTQVKKTDDVKSEGVATDKARTYKPRAPRTEGEGTAEKVNTPRTKVSE